MKKNNPAGRAVSLSNYLRWRPLAPDVLEHQRTLQPQTDRQFHTLQRKIHDSSLLPAYGAAGLFPGTPLVTCFSRNS